MHIPDGFLSTPVWVTMDVVAAGTVAVAVRRVNERLDPAKVPMMGVTGAFIFAAQMVNFPVAAGTSGHLLGAVLASVLLGPWAAILVMTTIFLVQCLLFQDGGLTALGANLFNMGIVGAGLGYLIYQGLRRLLGGREAPALFVAAWLSVMAGAAATSLELAASSTVAGSLVLRAMLGVHALIGVGEGLITVAAVRLIRRAGLDGSPQPVARDRMATR
jgi:cobalt/nickel transport system permease protein